MVCYRTVWYGLLSKDKLHGMIWYSMVWSVWYEMTNGQQLICHLHTSARHLHIFRRPEKPFHGTNPHPVFAWCTKIITFSSESALPGILLICQRLHIPSKWARTTMLYIHSQMKKWCGIISGITSKGRRVMFKGTFASQLFLRLALGYTWSDKGWSMLENKELILLFTVCCLVPYLPFLYLISIGGLIPINHSRREPLNRLQ